MIKIISFTICPFAQRAIAALEAKNIPYEVDFIDLADKPDWFLNLSPTRQVPILITEDGRVIHESDAIVEYIEDEYGELRKPDDNIQKATERAWSYQAAKHYLLQCSAQRSGDEESLNDRSADLKKVFDLMEEQLSGTTYFYGEKLSKVDIAWLPILHRAALIFDKTGYDFIGKNPKIKSWQSNLLKTGLAEKSVASNFVEKFYSFYLSDKTFLGAGHESLGGMDEVTAKMGDKG